MKRSEEIGDTVKNVVLVNDRDEELGVCDKLKAHLGMGVLHRAFSLFIFNSKEQLLLQKRGENKMLWPGYWSNSCCSHPFPGESYIDAARRRAIEELGIRCNPEWLYNFHYEANYLEIGSENELCSVLIAKTDMEPEINEEEISEYMWMDWIELVQDVQTYPEKYTPWFLLEVEEIKLRKNLKRKSHE